MKESGLDLKGIPPKVTCLYKVVNGKLKSIPVLKETQKGYYIERANGQRFPERTPITQRGQYVSKMVGKPFAYLTKEQALKAHEDHLRYGINQLQENLALSEIRLTQFLKYAEQNRQAKEKNEGVQG